MQELAGIYMHAMSCETVIQIKINLKDPVAKLD